MQPEAIWGGVIEKDTIWSFPVGNSAKSEMRGVYKDWDRYRGQAKRLAHHIEKEFNQEKIYSKFVSSLTSFYSFEEETLETDLLFKDL